MQIGLLISSFSEKIRKSIENQQVNILISGSLGKWLRYYEFLKIILNKYGELSSLYIETMEEQMALISNRADTDGKTEMDQDIWEIYQRANKIGLELHLQIESFYIFSQVLLDRIADSFGYCFDISWKKPGSSHTNLKNEFSNIVAQQNLNLEPINLENQIQSLSKSITTYRNKEIQHASEPRKLPGTSWSADKKTKIFITLLYPTEEEGENITEFQKNTEDLHILLEMIEEYMKSMINFFSSNFGNLTSRSA